MSDKKKSGPIIMTLNLNSDTVLQIINSFSTTISELDQRIERLEDLLNIKKGR